MGSAPDSNRMSLKAVIARAMAIESDDPRVTSAEIRTIAEELDERAILEAQHDHLSPPSIPRRARLDLAAGVLAAGATAGLSITLAGKVSGMDALITTAMFTSISTALLNLWHSSKVQGRSRYIVFNVVNAAAWASVGIGVAPMIVELAPVVFGIGSALGGTAIIALRDKRRRAEGRGSEPAGTTLPAGADVPEIDMFRLGVTAQPA